MEVFVNSQKVDITLENEKTVGDVLRAFEEEFCKNGATTVGIVLNGNEIDAEKFDEIEKIELSDSTKIELSVISSAEIRQMLSDESGAFKVIAEKLSDLPADFQGGRDKQANLLIATLAELVDRFCKTAKYASLFSDDFAPIVLDKIDGKTLAEFFQDLFPILNDFEAAISDGDTVLLGDLAEYEIRPRLISISNAIDSIESN